MTTIQLPLSRIYFLRHARAAQPQSGQRDFDRELNDLGYAEAEIVCEKAVDNRYRPDLIISSTAVRCRQTAEAMQRAMGGEIEIRMVDEIYNGTAEIYLALLAGQTDALSAMLVGHNPAIEDALETLIGRESMHSAIADGYPTAGLAVIDQIAGQTGWALHDFLFPR